MENGRQPERFDYGSGQRRRYLTCSSWPNVILLAGPLALAIILSFLLTPCQWTKVRDHASPVPCASNLRQICNALVMYANVNNNALPPSLDSLLDEEFGLEPGQLQCQRAAGKGTKVLLVYIPGQRVESDNRADVWVYEPLAAHNNGGANVLFSDAHVRWCTPQQLKDYLTQTRARIVQAASQPATTQPE